jgi:murein DD-endopeptidase MepM/ murein hydrolase activator NlpD
MLVSLLLGGCVTRPSDTDLFGRRIGDGPPPSGPASSYAPPRSTVSDGNPDDLLNGIELRPLPNNGASASGPVTANAVSVTTRQYVVQPGDTLRGIGNRTGAGSEAIAAANALPPPYTIRPGQRLTIPAGRYHEVLAGQTGIAIARAYGTSWSAIVAENQLPEPGVLRVGQRLRLPNGAIVAPPSQQTLEQRAAAFHLDIDDIVTGSSPAQTGPPQPPATVARGFTRFAWPVEGRLLQRFGPGPSGRRNEGIKIATPVGTPVQATAAGTVRYAGTEVPLLGGLVLVDHGNGWVSAYGHLDRVAVRTGQRVEAGAIIATSGESGQAREPQLHFELRQNRRPVDPLRELPVRGS